MHTHKKITGFTLVELVVVATILVVLTSIGFYSYVWNLQDSRDSARKADIAKLSSALTLYHQKRGVFPNPGSSFNLLNNGVAVASQWKMDKSVPLSTIDSLVYDPKNENSYSYSITTNKQEFQIAGTLENGDNPKAILDGNYTSVSVDILPTIMLASDSTTDLEINAATWAGPSNRLLFIFNGWTHNIPYDFDQQTASSDGTTFANLLSDPLIEYWQNSDYRTCTEIYEAWKSIGNGEYQILNSSGVLTWSGCLWM